MNVLNGFYNQGFKTFFCYFHQILMGNKMLSSKPSIVNMSTMFGSS
jgi:uncharacterized membrane protein